MKKTIFTLLGLTVLSFNSLLATENVRFGQDQKTTSGIAERYDNFGSSIEAHGDFNHDGYDDLVIGVPYEDVGSVKNAGGIVVVYGSSKGLKYKNMRWFDQNSKQVPGGVEADDRFGSSLVAGDFNKDGYTDLAVGVPGEDVGKVKDAGAIIILYGSYYGLRGYGSKWFDQDSKGIPGGVEAYDHFGAVLSAGDFNRDGYSDLVIGIPNEDIGKKKDAGAITMMYGSKKGLTGSGAKWFDQDSSGIPGGVEAYDNFGSSLATGDFNHNGYDDVAVGVPYEDLGKVKNAGAVVIICGSKYGLHGSGAQWLDQDTGGIPGGVEAYDYFGQTLATGDFNKDGYVDLAIGIPSEGIGSVKDAGGITIIYGSRKGLRPYSSSWFDQNTPGIPGHVEQYDRFGSSLSAGDFNRDGYVDLVVGIPHENKGTIQNAGAVTIIYGSNNGLRGYNAKWLDQNSPGVAGHVEAYDYFGLSLSMGDFNNDGYSDLAIGIPYEDIGNTINAGMVDIIYGK